MRLLHSISADTTEETVLVDESNVRAMFAVNALKDTTRTALLTGQDHDGGGRLPAPDRDHFVVRYEELLATGLAANPPHRRHPIAAAG